MFRGLRSFVPIEFAPVYIFLITSLWCHVIIRISCPPYFLWIYQLDRSREVHLSRESIIIHFTNLMLQQNSATCSCLNILWALPPSDHLFDYSLCLLCLWIYLCISAYWNPIYALRPRSNDTSFIKSSLIFPFSLTKSQSLCMNLLFLIK